MTQFNESAINSLALIQRAIRSCELFRNWPESALDQVAGISHMGRYSRGARIPQSRRDQLGMLLVVSGCMEISGMNDAGTKFMLGLWGPNEVTGLVRLIPEDGEISDCYAHDNSVIVHIPAREFRAVLDKWPHLWKDVALLALERQRDSIVAARRRALGRMQLNLAARLLQLKDWYGKTDDGGSITMWLSQNDLASMLAVSRQTMNKELRLLAEQGILAVDYGCVTILDVPALEKLAQAPL